MRCKFQPSLLMFSIFSTKMVLMVFSVIGSGDGTLHAWNINMQNEVWFISIFCLIGFLNCTVQSWQKKMEFNVARLCTHLTLVRKTSYSAGCKRSLFFTTLPRIWRWILSGHHCISLVTFSFCMYIKPSDCSEFCNMSMWKQSIRASCPSSVDSPLQPRGVPLVGLAPVWQIEYP